MTIPLVYEGNNFENTQLIGREMKVYKRKIRESLEMKKLDQLNVGLQNHLDRPSLEQIIS